MMIDKLDNSNFPEYIDRLDKKVTETRDSFLKELIYNKFVKYSDIDNIFKVYKSKIQNLNNNNDFGKSCREYLKELLFKIENTKPLLYKFRLLKIFLYNLNENENNSPLNNPLMDDCGTLYSYKDENSLEFWENNRKVVEEKLKEHTGITGRAIKRYLSLIDMIIQKIKSRN